MSGKRTTLEAGPDTPAPDALSGEEGGLGETKTLW